MLPDLIFQPVWPWPLLAGLSALAIAACAFAYHQQRALASRGRRTFLLLFRLAGVASILFILLRPMMREATVTMATVIGRTTQVIMAATPPGWRPSR